MCDLTKERGRNGQKTNGAVCTAWRNGEGHYSCGGKSPFIWRRSISFCSGVRRDSKDSISRSRSSVMVGAVSFCPAVKVSTGTPK
nr:MAG TPA: hypothetical protein [Caudoviricetes sp.]